MFVSVAAAWWRFPSIGAVSGNRAALQFDFCSPVAEICFFHSKYAFRSKYFLLEYL